MAVYRFHFLRASLSITDVPVGYSPPRGPEVRFRVTYNQREAYQPATFFFSNFGKRWVHDWMSYIEDDPSAVGNPIELYVRGGGREPYEGFVNGVSKPQQDIRAVMTIAPASAAGSRSSGFRSGDLSAAAARTIDSRHDGGDRDRIRAQRRYAISPDANLL